MNKAGNFSKNRFDIYDNIVPFFRIAGLVIAIIINLKFSEHNILNNRIAPVFLLLYSLYSLFLLIFKKLRKKIAFRFSFVLAAIDMLMISYAIAISGSSQSGYYLFYIIFISFYSMSHTLKHSLSAGFISIIYYGTTVFLSEGTISDDVIFRLVFFLFFSLFVGYLNEKLHNHTLKIAMHDKLTNLYNYEFFYSNLDYILEECSKNNSSAALVILDIDNFKKYNDEEGHLEGDRILEQLSSIIRQNIRSQDIAARYGGDEFTIVLPDTDGDKAYAICERIMNLIHEIFRTTKGEHITISIGIAGFPAAGSKSKELFHAADQALYEAKSNGKNRIVSKC